MLPDEIKEYNKKQILLKFGPEQLGAGKKFNRCVLTLENLYCDNHYECDFDILFFQMKANRAEYNKALELQ